MNVSELLLELQKYDLGMDVEQALNIILNKKKGKVKLNVDAIKNSKSYLDLSKVFNESKIQYDDWCNEIMGYFNPNDDTNRRISRQDIPPLQFPPLHPITYLA